ncbi:MAG: hypothetical protein HQK89_04845 [Nitrospirae bacterium]|nr:hypothetical protein [Nitrospirota bacterium]
MTIVKEIDLEAGKDAIAIAEERFGRKPAQKIGLQQVDIESVLEHITQEFDKLNEHITLEYGLSRAAIEKSIKKNIKWMFFFWISQLAAIAGIFKLLIK